MLKRKMFRDIRLNLSQFITIFLMIFLGVMVYAGVRSYMEGMQNTANVFYSENNLQDLDAVGQNFTSEDLETIKNIEHVKNAERILSIRTTLEDEKDVQLETIFIESNEISKFFKSETIPSIPFSTSLF